MSSSPSPCSDDIRRQAFALGADACGFARAETVELPARSAYEQWIAEGKHGTMQYCARHCDVRSDPRELLQGARTVISCAFSYYTGDCSLPLAKHIARYAWGADYHWIVRQRLTALGDYIKSHYGGEYRVCVDSAPIRERYWAVRSGIGMIGRNNQLIVPGVGSYCFLGEVIWTGELPADPPCTLSCDNCHACIKACPGQALDADGCDASKCLSYLTIEHRGELPDGTDLQGHFYGCDVCQQVCRHNAKPKLSRIAEFAPDRSLLSLTVDDLQTMTSSHFRRLTRTSAISRIPLKQLLRNIEHGTVVKSDDSC